MDFSFDPAKDEELIRERGVSFEDAIRAVQSEKFLRIPTDSKKTEYAGQELLLFMHPNSKGHDYVHVCVLKELNNGQIRLITIYPSHKHDKKYREALL